MTEAKRASPQTALGYIDRLEIIFAASTTLLSAALFVTIYAKDCEPLALNVELRTPSMTLSKRLLCLASFMAAKIGRKPYLNIEVVIIVLGRLFGKRAEHVC